jgi:ABC-type nitrate/sulfonate/bicarbonate transport system substrate-binding protein
MLQIGNSPDRFTALSTGKIDGMVADPADVVRAKRQGFNVLIDLTTKGIDYHGNGITMPELFIRDKRETALKFLRGYVEGVHYYKTHPEESVRIVAAHLKTNDLDMLRQGWKVFTERLIPMKPYSSIKDIQLIIQEMATQNPAAKNALPERFIDSSLMEEIDRSGFIDRLYR